jgi:nucleotide-binding universal stress UspA family protein
MTTANAETSLPVLVGVDDSPGSLAAMRVAADEAQLRGTELHVVHAWHFPALWGAQLKWPEEVNPRTHLRDSLQAEIAEMQSERAAAGKPAVTVVAELVEGEVEPQLRAAAEKCSLVVLGARTHHGPREILGSVSHAFVIHPPCPVLIVPAPGH